MTQRRHIALALHVDEAADLIHTHYQGIHERGINGLLLDIVFGQRTPAPNEPPTAEDTAAYWAEVTAAGANRVQYSNRLPCLHGQPQRLGSCDRHHHRSGRFQWFFRFPAKYGAS
jgi:hypothetical protein